MGGNGALKVALNSKDRNHYDVMVIRLDRNGNLVESSPCLMCVNILKMYNIRRIYYSNINGDIEYKKVSELTGDPTGTTARVRDIMPLKTKIMLGLI